MVRDLADPEVALCGKNKEAALEAKQKGNKCFLRSDYAEALDCYTQVLLYLKLLLYPVGIANSIFICLFVCIYFSLAWGTGIESCSYGCR